MACLKTITSSWPQPLSQANMHSFVVELLEALRLDQNKLLIKEDVAFLNHLISSIEENDSSPTLTPSLMSSPASYLTISVVSAAAVAAIGAIFANYQPSLFDVTAIAGASFGLFIFGRHFLIKRFLSDITKDMLLLSNHLLSGKSTMKQLLTVINEADQIERSCPEFGQRTVRLRRTLAHNCQLVFNVLRSATKQLRQDLAATLGDEDEYSSISSLPIETFSELLNEAQVPTVKQLQSLIQLLRLQISEFLRRIICFLLFHKGRQLSFRALLQLTSRIRFSIAQFINCTRQPIGDLEELKNYYEALWLSENSSDPLDVESHFSNLRIDLHSVQTSLKTSIVILQDLISPDTSKSRDSKSLLDAIDTSITELNNSLDILKSCQINLLKELSSDDPEQIEVPEPVEIHKEPKDDQEEEELKDYEIFEDSTLASANRGQSYSGDTQEDQWQSKKKIGLPINLNKELKAAISIKAQEHRERMAKALGIPADQVPAQLADADSNDSLPAVNDDADYISDKQAQEQRRADMIRMQESFNFPRQLANIAAIRSKELNFVADAESFGDDSDDSDADKAAEE